MIALEELVSMNNISGEQLSDRQIIEQYFTLNENEDEGIELMARLAKSKSERLESSISFAREWAFCAFSRSWIKSFGAEGAEVLNRYTTWFLLHCKIVQVDFCHSKIVPTEEIPSVLLGKLKEIVPTHNRNKCVPFLSYALDYLHELGLYFKNEKTPN